MTLRAKALEEIVEEAALVFGAYKEDWPGKPLFTGVVTKALRAVVERWAEDAKDLAWLDEFVVEPEWFPNEGDRQYWQERRAAIRRRDEG